MEKTTPILTLGQVEILVQNLMEIPTKYGLPMIQLIQKMVDENTKNEEVKKENESTATIS